MNTCSDTVKLHVEDLGINAPALVFLHYWGGSSRTWRHVTQSLRPAFRTIAIDQRGWGQSDKPPGGYTLAALADDAQRLIESLGLDRYILVGHSMGGKVAQLLASRHPAGLAGLVLVAPSPPSPMNVPLAVRQGMVNAYDSRESILATVRQVLAASSLQPDDLEIVMEDSLQGAPAAKVAWPLAASQEDISAQAALIRVPTLVISGEKDQVDPPAVLQRELMTRIPYATLHILSGIGHLSPLEAPGDLSDLIRGFAAPLVGAMPSQIEPAEGPLAGLNMIAGTGERAASQR
ncbi:alpha/beta fold hydrolase [Pandoraea terrigena]|uniref:Arylesterase n=1 Tax=Pandoraea terrigena TaxID=2508292 RepID=A0A5E4SD26_9BURK|nr:alpha/beta hydrolase [Pandoraea terrigena]VVD73776.1 Arylesterase [Pandoraea terrigena]